jgi:hypothetical protein
VTSPFARTLLVAVVAVVAWSSLAHAGERAPAEAPDDEGSTTVDDDGEAEAPARAVTLLPLVPGRTVTSKQARGITARVREALVAVAEEGAVRLLPETRDDDKVVRRCVADVDCYRDVAKARGADRLGFGTVDVEVGGGLRVTLRLTSTLSSSTPPLTAVFAGERGDDLERFDRLAREAFAEESLRGDLVVEGQPGDAVLIDGRRRGTIDASKQYAHPRLREGQHHLEVRRSSGQHGTRYEPFTRDVVITHRQTTTLKALLLPAASTAGLATEPTPTTAGPPLLPIVTGGAGVVLLLTGGVFGALAVTTSTEVEERAQQQQLVFPRDTGLVQQGRAFGLVAVTALVAGGVGAAAGAAWWLLTPNTPTEGDVDDSGAVTGGAR